MAGPHKHFRVGIERAGSGAPDALDNACAQLGSSGQRRHHEPQMAPQCPHSNRPPSNATPTQSFRPAQPPTTRSMPNLPEYHREKFKNPHVARHAPRRVRDLTSRNKRGCKILEAMPAVPSPTIMFSPFLILKRGSSSAFGTPCGRALPARSPPGTPAPPCKMHGFAKVSAPRSPPGVYAESPRSPPETHGVPTESPQKPRGVPAESPWSPRGVPTESPWRPLRSPR